MYSDPNSRAARRYQIATLNFLDAFLRTRSQVLVASDAFTAVELWMGIVHVYTCKDSLSTCQVSTTARVLLQITEDKEIRRRVCVVEIGHKILCFVKAPLKYIPGSKCFGITCLR